VPDQPLDLLVQFDGLPLYLRGVGDVVRGEIRVTAVSPLAPGDETRALFTPPPGYAMRSAYSVLFGGGARPAAPAGD